MRPLVALTATCFATLAVWGTATATADAAYLKSFTVRDNGATVRWSVTVCTAGHGRVRRFSAQLVPESQGVPYRRVFSGGASGPGCDRWSMSANDIWTEQVWSSQLTVIMGDGQILRSGFRDFYIE